MTERHARPASERGEGNIGNLIMLILAALAVVAAYNAGPMFRKNWELQDKLSDISRSFPPGEKGNESAREAVAQAILDVGLSDYLSMDDCSVTNQGMIGGTRTVKCTYTREIKWIPGVVRPYTFEPSATAPTF